MKLFPMELIISPATGLNRILKTGGRLYVNPHKMLKAKDFMNSRLTGRMVTEFNDASDAIGIASGTPVVAGAGDGGCAIVGIGSVEPGITYNYPGSSSWISTTLKMAVEDPKQLTFSWAHPVPGFLQPCVTMQTAGSPYSRLKDQLAR